MENKKYCRVCCNATVEPELNSNNDLSYISVGRIDEGFNIYIRSGNNKPTALIVTQFIKDRDIQINVDIGEYRMKYCPECGRKLIENR